jgi:hypothetical protein
MMPFPKVSQEVHHPAIAHECRLTKRRVNQIAILG